MYRLLLTLSAFALLLPLAPAAPVPKDAGNRPVYFPTQKGAKLTYQCGDREETYVVTGVADKGGDKIISLGQEVKGRTTPYCDIKLTKEGGQELVENPAPSGSPFLLLHRSVKPGYEREEDIEGTVGETTKFKVAVRGPEKIKVPAGTFEAIRVETTITVGFEGRSHVLVAATSWYAPGVGLIRRESNGKELGVLKSFTPSKE